MRNSSQAAINSIRGYRGGQHLAHAEDRLSSREPTAAIIDFPVAATRSYHPLGSRVPPSSFRRVRGVCFYETRGNVVSEAGETSFSRAHSVGGEPAAVGACSTAFAWHRWFSPLGGRCGSRWGFPLTPARSTHPYLFRITSNVFLAAPFGAAAAGPLPTPAHPVGCAGSKTIEGNKEKKQKKKKWRRLCLVSSQSPPPPRRNPASGPRTNEIVVRGRAARVQEVEE